MLGSPVAHTLPSSLSTILRVRRRVRVRVRVEVRVQVRVSVILRVGVRVSRVRMQTQHIRPLKRKVSRAKERHARTQTVTQRGREISR